MATITAEPRTPARGPASKRILFIACGAALTLMVAAGIGVWQIAERGDGTDTASRAPAAGAPAAGAGAAPVSDQEMYQRQQRAASEGAGTMGGVAERTRLQEEPESTVRGDGPDVAVDAPWSPVTPAAAAGAVDLLRIYVVATPGEAVFLVQSLGDQAQASFLNGEQATSYLVLVGTAGDASVAQAIKDERDAHPDRAIEVRYLGAP